MQSIRGQITLLGGGNMGKALAKGVLAGGLIEEQQLAVADPSPSIRKWWQENHPCACVAATAENLIPHAEVVIVAVKPAHVQVLATQYADFWAKRLIISVAAGVTLCELQAAFKSGSVVRVMPNTPALVAAGAAAFCCGPDVNDDQVALVHQIFAAVGTVDRVDETLMDAVTGLSGSGPAYMFLILEALADGGVAAGLSRELAQRLASQTMLGAAKLVLDSQHHPAILKDAVASPGGTTITGLAMLERKGLRSALIQAVQAAAQRSRELGMAAD